MLREGDRVTAIGFDGEAHESVIMSMQAGGYAGASDHVAVLPKCAAGDHSDCVRTHNGHEQVRHGWVAFLDEAIEGVHYALGWDTDEAKALKAVVALGTNDGIELAT